MPLALPPALSHTRLTTAAIVRERAGQADLRPLGRTPKATTSAAFADLASIMIRPHRLERRPGCPLRNHAPPATMAFATNRIRLRDCC